MRWTKRGWGNNFSTIFSTLTPYYVDIRHPNTMPNTTLLYNAFSAIRDIVENHPKPYYLLVSGGIDSQAMLWLWHLSGVEFTAVSFEYISDGNIMNGHDLIELDAFTTEYGIPVLRKEKDIIKFLTTELVNYAEYSQCTSPQICTHMAMCDTFDAGTIILSGNFAVDFGYTYTNFGIERFADSKNSEQLTIIPFFFMYTADLAWSIRNEHRGRTENMYHRKLSGYQYHKIPVKPQPDKFTGFEKIKDYCDEFYKDRVTIRDRLKYANMPSKRVFDILFRYRLTDKIKYIDNLFIVA
jgi:hypothetical protein